ncbi:S53 family peptidase [Roseateles agri]|uniref:S53 family peptidase n=1 Tax=Roseateles agri TaxID=3098619 RepID=UPI002A59C523|nr:S53 family peptidase [Paucibacter sp. R3-3]
MAAALALVAVGAQAGNLTKAVAPQALAVDNGLAASTDVIDVAISLKANNLDDLKAFVASTVDPSSPNYHQFITPAQFAARYGQSISNVLAVKSYLEANGLTVNQVYSNNLLITASGTNAQLSALFGTTQHSFTSVSGGTFQRAMNKPMVPAALQGIVSGVSGISTEPRFRPHNRQLPAELAALSAPAVSTVTATRSTAISKTAISAVASPEATPVFTNPQSYGVKQVATRYNLDPLYAAGYNGAGKTIGIMTFAAFNTAWPTSYWSAVGVNHTGSVTVVTACPSTGSCTIGTAGSGETALDIEQSGGLAPAANVIVYEAPNTDAGSLALYTKAITANVADTLSISWGLTELAYGPDDLAPYDTLFLQAASQGVPVMAASADGGAYDVAGAGYPYPNYSNTLAVDFPASSPYVIGAGGTTLPLSLASGAITVTQERPWGWDYLQSYVGAASYYANYFPVGAGGGVSVQYALPDYQKNLPGTRTSVAGQMMVCMIKTTTNTSTGVQGCNVGDIVISPLPAGFAGRNVPDISMNADPESGYAVFSTSSGNGTGTGTWGTGSGGTSFVAPQLNGIFTVLAQKAGHRLGWLHPQLYGAFRTQGYGSGSPFRPVTAGTNLYYPATNSYNPATGLGTIDAANMSAIFN